MLLVLFWGGVSARALTRRHDRTDAQYTGFANEAKFAPVGKVVADTGGQWVSLGSGTLISPDWVLTAGHAIAGSVTFTAGGSVYTADPSSYAIHPGTDLGLFKLTSPVTGVTPALRYTSGFGSEIGREGLISGYGNSGTGLTGEVEPAGTKRAGQNMIDWNGADWGWSSDLLLVDFDSPSAGALNLECGPAHGDSGGGIFVDIADQTYLTGVQNWMWQNDGTENADYGDGGAFIRVSQYNDWIDGIVPASTFPVDVVAVDNSAALAGYVTQDLVVNTASDWLSAQLRVTLNQPGGVYQDEYGSANPQSPDPVFFSLLPTLEFDSYVSNGVLGESVGTAGAVDLGGPVTPVFDEDDVSITWYTTDADDIGELALSRLTLADDATGRWSFQATASPPGGPAVRVDGYVVHGRLVLELGGDLDGDGFVSQHDLDIALSEWGNHAPLNDPRADPDGNGIVAQGDLDYVLADWGQGLLPGAPVAEPSTMLLLALGTAALLRRKRR